MKPHRVGASVAAVVAVVVIGGLAWWAGSDGSSDPSVRAIDEVVAAPPDQQGETVVTTAPTTSTTEPPTTSTIAPTTTVAPATRVEPSLPASTVVVRYRPFDGAGALVEPVLALRPGSCAGRAFAADAYRCTADDEIHDPCSAPPGDAPTQVACLASIPGAGAILLELTDPLPTAGQPTDGPETPFVFVLDDGSAFR